MEALIMLAVFLFGWVACVGAFITVVTCIRSAQYTQERQPWHPTDLGDPNDRSTKSSPAFFIYFPARHRHNEA